MRFGQLWSVAPLHVGPGRMCVTRRRPPTLPGRPHPRSSPRLRERRMPPRFCAQVRSTPTPSRSPLLRGSVFISLTPTSPWGTPMPRLHRRRQVAARILFFPVVTCAAAALAPNLRVSWRRRGGSNPLALFARRGGRSLVQFARRR